MTIYKVTARNWPPVSGYGHDHSPELRVQFGERDSFHELTDAEVVAAIILHGRAEITVDKAGNHTIDFQNDYD